MLYFIWLRARASKWDKTTSMNKRLFIIFILGFSSGLPMALLSSTLQAWFASVGMSVMLTGMLSLLGMPYVYKMLWAPIVDHYTLHAMGKRRSWIVATQILLLIGFNVLAWCTPVEDARAMIAIALILAFCSATQDIVIDAHRTEYLPVSEHGVGASVAVIGYRLALVFSGGLALIMAYHYGWMLTYRVMGLFMIPGVVATLLSREPSRETVAQRSLLKTFVNPIKALLAREGIVSLLLFIFFYKLGEAFTASTSGVMMPFLINGIGFSLETVGIINKMVGVGALLLGGLLSGFLLLRWSLYRALFLFGILQAMTNLLFVALAIVGKNVPLLAIAAVSDNLAAGMGTTALVALIMRIVDKRYTATQFSIYVAFAALPRILSGAMAGKMQLWFGWVGLFEWSFLFALCFIPFLGRVRGFILRHEALDNSTGMTTVNH